MIVDISQNSQSALAEYARVSIAFEVREVMDVIEEPPPARHIRIVPRPIADPWVKDYDTDGGPHGWQDRFDLRYWTFLSARDNGRLVGGAAVVYAAPDIDMLDGRRDIALLWDIRVAPDARRTGVGRALLDAAEVCARARGATWLEVETQNINAAACRFYAGCGFELHAANRDAYPGLPNEVQLIWRKRVGDRALELRARRQTADN